MKKVLLSMLMALLVPFATLQAQEIITLDDDISLELTPGASYTFYDSGGPTANYGTSENYTATFTNNGNITINFASLATESSSSCNNWDYMLIYDGDATSGNLIGRAQTGCSSSLQVGVDYTAESGTLTIEWHSDGSATAAGWEATITAEAGSSCAKPSLEVSEIQSNEATLTWADGSGTYHVEYKKASDANWTTALSGTALLTTTLTNLKSSTSYQARVASICGNDTSSFKSVSFTTPCAEITEFPWVEDFESMTASTVPACWDNSASTTSSSKSYVWGVYSYSGNNMLRMYNFMVQTGTALINTPSIVLPAAPDYELTFEYSNRANCGDLVLKVSDDGGETWSALEPTYPKGTASTDYTDPGEFTEALVSLSAYAGQTIMLQFYSEANYGSGAIFLDNIDIHRVSSCVTPSDVAVVGGSVSKNAAQIEWTANAGESAWKLQYKKSSASEWTTLDVTENPYLLNGLDSFTVYDVKVAAACDEEDISKYSKAISFRTAAAAPYHEGFGRTPVSGWSFYSGSLAGIEEGTDSLVAVNTGWSFGSVNGVFPDSAKHAYLGISGANCHYWLVSPVVELEDDLQLTFDLALTKATGTLQRVDAGAQDSAKFVVLITADGGESWEKFEDPGTWDTGTSSDAFDNISYSANGQAVAIDLSAFAGQSVQIAFYGEAGSQDASNNLHISNVDIDVIPACSGSLSLEATGVTATAATLVWDEEDGAQWEFACIANPAAEYVPTEADFTGSTGESSVTLDTLTENTNYVFYLRRNCEGARSSVKSVKIHTIQTPASLPYADDFESANNWVLVNGNLTNAWAWGTAANNGGTHALYVSNDGGESNAYTTNAAAMVYATKSFEFEENATYTFKYDWKANGESSYDYLRVALVPASVVLEAATSAPTGFDATHLPTGWVALDGGSKLNGVTAWQTFSTDLEVQAGTYVVVLAWIDDTSTGSQAPAAVDNFSISVLNCARPTNLRTIEDGVTTNSALLTWDPEGTESNWLIRYKKANDADWTELAEPAVNDTFNLEGLEPSSVYSIEVAAWCDPTDSTTISEYSDAISVATECGVVASFPWHADFEDMPASTVPVCWDNSASTTEDKSSAYVWGVYESNGNKMIRMNNYWVHTGTALINTPSIILPQSGAYELSFDYAHNATCGDFTVKASIDGGANWTDLQSYTKGSGSSYSDPGEFTEAVINLAAYAGDTILLQFFTNANYGSGAIFVDNLDIHVLPACAKPTGLAVELTQGNGTIATLSWDTLDAHAWVLQYGLDAEFANAQEVEVDTAYASLTGLTPESTYYARVKSACDEGGESPWSATLSFVPTNAYWMSINNGTSTSYYVPSALYYADGGQSHSQFIIPADSLKDIQWAVIDQLTFYATASTADIASDRFEVYVAEVEATTLSSMAAWTSLNKVKNASALAIEGGKMVVSLDAPFVYEGGNLLIGFKQTAGSDYVNLSWYGISAPSGASYYSYYDSDYSYTSSYASSFLPKVTFGYMPGQEPACLKVQNIQASKRTASSAEISWTKGAASQNAWQIAIDTLATFDPDSVDLINATDTFYAFSGLEEETTYYLYVRANCGAEDGVSAWSARASFVTTSACEKPADVKADSITTTSALISWETFGLDSFLLRYRAGSTGAYDTLGVHCPVLLDGLTPATTYQVQVKAACDTTNLAAKWTTAIRFSTDCEPIDTLAWHEGFESMTTGSASSAAPLCWSILNANDGAYPYIFVNNSSSYVKTGSKSLYFQSSSTRKGYAILPEFQMAANKLRVIFSYRNEGVSASNGTLSFGYMTDITEDSSFVEIASYPQTTTFTEVVAYCNSIPDSLASSARLAFCYTGGTSNNYYLGIDDITVEEIPACVDVADIEISGRTASSAVINWTKGSEEQDAWQIAMSTDKTFNPDDELAPIEVTSIPYTLNELIADTTYYLYVRANCGGGEYSAWSKLVSFKTARECETPDDLKLDSVSLNSAKISWYGYGLNTFNLRYGKGSVWSDTIENIAMPYLLEGLEPGSNYSVQVQAACGSEWSSSLSFSTAYGTPFEEDFDATSKPANWSIYSGQLQADGTANLSSGSGWSFGAGSNGVFDNHAYSNIFGTGCYKWLATPAIELGDNLHLMFNLALTKYSGLVQPVTAGQQADDKFVVLISTNNGDSWAVLRQWDNAGSEYVYDNIACSATGERDTIDLSAYAGQSAIIAFYGESTASGGDNNIHVDNVAIDILRSCFKPTGLKADRIAVTEAAFSWDAEEDAAWQYYYALASAAPNDSLFIDIDTNAVVIDELAEMTSYVFYLRKNCGEEKSLAISKSFNTIQQPVSIPFADNFESGNSWLLINGEQDNVWVVDTAAHNGEGTHALYISNDGGVSNAYSVTKTTAAYATKAIEVEEDGKYIFSYDWRAVGEAGYSIYDYMRVLLAPAAAELTAGSLVSGLSTGATAVPEGWIALDGGALHSSADWQKKSVTASVPAGLYKVVVLWKNDGSSGANPPAAIDNFSIEQKPCVQPSALAAANITPRSATISWTAGAEDQNAWQLAIGTEEGFDPDEVQPLEALSNTYELAGLNAETTYYLAVRANCGEGEYSAWSSVYSFATLPMCTVLGEPVDTTICAGDAYTWRGNTYSVSGIYYDTLISVAGCDSILSLELTVAPAQDTLSILVEKDTICQGDTYEWNGQEYTAAGLYSVTITSSYGCDSIAKLELSIYEAEDTIFDAVTIKEDQLPFIYKNAEHPYIAGEAGIEFPEGTALGEHKATALVEGEHCAAVLELTLTVEKSQGIDNIFDLDGKNVQKVLYRDVLYIVINNEWYNAEGKKVNKPE